MRLTRDNDGEYDPTVDHFTPRAWAWTQQGTVTVLTVLGTLWLIPPGPLTVRDVLAVIGVFAIAYQIARFLSGLLVLVWVIARSIVSPTYRASFEARVEKARRQEHAEKQAALRARGL